MEEKEKKENQEVLREFNPEEQSSMNVKKIGIIVFVAILLGVGTGYVLANKNVESSAGIKTIKEEGSISKGTVVGSTDTKTFKDLAVGVLEEGGIEGEGQYHLVRPGGDSQNVYLTSSVVDLFPFKKRKIKVWGETNAAKSAGWLMDVGRVELLE